MKLTATTLSIAGIFTSLWLNAHLTAEVSLGQVAFPLFVRAIGTGFGFVPLTMLGVASLPPAQRPGGTALFNLTPSSAPRSERHG